jgi:hypothetical protein
LRGWAALIAATCLQGCSVAPEPPAAGNPPSDDVITLVRQGSFEAGGSVIGTAGATTHCDHGHVEYQIPLGRRETSLFLWHSSSAAAWQRRWDGGPGFESIFLRRKFPVYIWDGPRVGRANFGCVAYSYTPPQGADESSFRAWRFGPSPGVWFDGVQFPTRDADAWDQAMRARYDEFDTVENARLEAKAAAAAIDRIGPSVLVTNSAGGLRAMLAALESDKVVGIVAYETPGLVWPDDVGENRRAGKYGPAFVSSAEFAKLTRIPIQFVWGDNVRASATWGPLARETERLAELINARGGSAEVLHLPDAGLHGNTHLPFADLNNGAVADLLSQFLALHGLDRHPRETSVPQAKEDR